MDASESSAESRGRQRVTLKDVAQLARVDASAVSRVINNDPNFVITAETRARILSAVRELGYHANHMARSLRMARSGMLGLVIPDLSNPMYLPIMQGAQHRAEELGYGLVLGSQLGGATHETFARLLGEGRVDGLLVASGVLDDEAIRAIAQSGQGPVVTVNRRVTGVASSVVLDDEGGSRLAVEYLAARGHRVIAGVFGPPGLDTTQRRLRGFTSAISAVGCVSVIVTAPSWGARDGHDEVLRLLATRPEVTALFAATFMIGVGALRAADESKVRVPRQLSVISMHDADLANYLNPPLTTVAMPARELGVAAVDVLVRQLHGGPSAEVVVAGVGTVIERRSVGKLRVTANSIA
jgi:LacI family transcriptional regulator